MTMYVGSHRSILVVILACGCGPSTSADDDGPVTEGDVSGSVGEGPSTTSTGVEATSGSEATTSTDATTGIDASSSGTTGSSDGAVECFVDGSPENDECCPELPQPCPMFNHDCFFDFDCSAGAFDGPVLDPMAAQCMLAGLAEGGVAVYERQASLGVDINVHEQWLVGDAGVTRVSWGVGGFSFGYGFATCQLADASLLGECAVQDDPQALSDCLGMALVGCEEVEEAFCPLAEGRAAPRALRK